MQNATNGVKQFEATDAASRTNFNTALQSVDTKFGASTGHTHDGTAGNGPKIGTSGIADGAVTPAKLSFNPSTQWYAAASGTANVYSVTLNNPTPSAYAEGMPVAVKINVTNTGASTINVNGLGAKAIKKANGNDVASGNLKAGSIYTLRYDGSANFILQGEGGSGTAQPAQVLSGYTFSNDSGDQSGSMADNGAVAITPGTSNKAIPAGYHNGSGYVLGDADLVAGNIKSGVDIFGVTGTVLQALGTATASQVLEGYTASNVNSAGFSGSMPNRGAPTWTPTTADQALPAGYYSGGTVKGDGNLSASNILSGVSIFGVTGNVVPGYNASGTATVSSTSGTFYSSGGSTYNVRYITVSGLTFKPKAVMLWEGVTYTTSYIEGASTTPISLNGGGNVTQTLQLSGSAYAVQGGFQLPFRDSTSGTVVNWIAYG